MSFGNKSKGIKLFVFVDYINRKADYPKLVIIKSCKTIGTLQEQFFKYIKAPLEDQHWIFDGRYCYEEFTIDKLVNSMRLHNNGYICVLFILKEEEKEALDKYYVKWLEERYNYEELVRRWRKPVDSPIIVAETVDFNEIKKMVWVCKTCTFNNKPYMTYCQVCGSSRPDDYIMPENYIMSQEDVTYMKNEKKREEQEKQLAEKIKENQLKEREEHLKNLKNLYKNDVVLNKEIIECPVCVMEYPAGEAIVLKACFHTFCRACLKEFLKNIDDPKVKCPEETCCGVLEDREIQALLSEEDYDKYQKLNLRTAEGKLGVAAFHCKTANCESWVLFDDDVNFYKCPLCKKENCILCRAIHEGMNCKEYQEELAIKAKNDAAAQRDLEYMQKLIDDGEAMKCPVCKILIQKKQGCDWMRCNMCKTELCWATKGPRWGPKGQGDTSGGCKCRTKEVPKCHPNCINCH